MKHKYKYRLLERIFKYYNFHFFILIISVLCSQKANAQDFCSTETYSNNSSFELDVQNANAQGPYYVKVYVHVIRNSMGNGGQSDQDVQDAITILQQDFNPHDIFFIWDCEIDYIDDDIWFVGPAGNSNGIFSVNNHYDGIDIYLFPAAANSPGGKANGVGSSSEFWVSGTWPTNNLPVAQSHIISHEMGHVINLFHTHHGCEFGGIWELISGANCTTAGDFVCDTPADPHLSFNVNAATCEWDGVNSTACTPPEPLSNYMPDENIIMAYTTPECMAYFTEGQGDRMRNSIETLSYLQATLTTDSPGNCGGDCGTNITHSGTINSGDYEVSNSIVSTATIGSNQDVIYDAGNFISLNPNFLADASNGSVFFAVIDGCGGLYRVEQEEAIMDNPVTFKNYPNPFTGQTTIEFTLVEDAPVTLFVSDAMGRQITVLLQQESKSEGTHHITFDGNDYPAGMYYYTIQAGEYIGTQKMTLIK